jgi:hypothetical protein
MSWLPYQQHGAETVCTPKPSANARTAFHLPLSNDLAVFRAGEFPTHATVLPGESDTSHAGAKSFLSSLPGLP